MSNYSEQELDSLRRQLAEMIRNLRLLQERKAQYVMETDVPLQLVKTERRLRESIAELKARIAQLERAEVAEFLVQDKGSSSDRIAELKRAVVEPQDRPEKAALVHDSHSVEPLEAARKIRESDKRAEALIELVPLLPTPMKSKVLQEALTVAWDIRDTAARSRVLTALVPHLLEIVRQTNGWASEASALGTLGLAYANLGDTSRVISYYEQILALVREIGDLRVEGEARSNLGLAYAVVGEFVCAVEHYERAIAIARQLNDRYAEAVRLQNLGLVFLRLADAEPNQRRDGLSHATEQFRQALQIFETIEAAPFLRARTRYHLGRCYYQLGRWREAITLLERARETFSHHKAYPELAYVLLELGQLYFQSQDFESAYIYLKDALRLFRRLKDTDGIAVTQEALGSLALQTARPAEAIVSLQEARQGYTSLRRGERIREVDDLLRMAEQARQIAQRTGATL